AGEVEVGVVHRDALRAGQSLGQHLVAGAGLRHPAQLADAIARVVDPGVIHGHPVGHRDTGYELFGGGAPCQRHPHELTAVV
ncbi:hypothetical protein DF186_21720, partial [Enterococcus hirae]